MPRKAAPVPALRDITRHTENIDQRDRLRRMELELQGGAQPPAKRPDCKQPIILSPMDIYCISAVGFHRTLKQLDTSAFITSLYKIDWIIEEKEIESIRNDAVQDEITNEELISQRLPHQYREFADVFSKAASDVLAPHRPSDLRIELEKDHKLTISPLYQYSAEELKTCKQYLVENLSKGFIEPSQSLFAAPILFAYKGDRGL